MFLQKKSTQSQCRFFLDLLSRFGALLGTHKTLLDDTFFYQKNDEQIQASAKPGFQ
jgi:hypothetical protein